MPARAGVDPDQEDVEALWSFGSVVETERTFDPAKIWANIAWAAVPAFQTRTWGTTVTTMRTARPIAPSRPGVPG